MYGETSFIGTARFEDGTLTVKITAVKPYGARSVSVDVEITDEKIVSKIESGFEAAIKSVRGELEQKSAVEAGRAAVIAGDNKESIYAE
jgi:hypothetical protein